MRKGHWVESSLCRTRSAAAEAPQPVAVTGIRVDGALGRWSSPDLVVAPRQAQFLQVAAGISPGPRSASKRLAPASGGHPLGRRPVRSAWVNRVELDGI